MSFLKKIKINMRKKIKVKLLNKNIYKNKKIL